MSSENRSISNQSAESLEAFTAASLRSLHLLNPERSALLVVDVQEKLIPAIQNHSGIVHNIGRLLQGAAALGVPILMTEQYPQGLGSTIDVLARHASARLEKSMFSCRQLWEHFQRLQSQQIEQLVVVGIETHVCIQQTCLDLLAQGFAIQVVVDAVGARHALDHRVALQRMANVGATWTTTEAVLFEWCVDSKHPQFKTISQLVKQTAPPFSESQYP